ncbi:FKBP-type peptidyl-prolyl cis-trans isomerase [Catenovulum sp. 2E275]|uniref:FKBP-type peptidyl-prolyl cis-trans isomerase n=1 Tax=Catenovulum sp. 2E275 TaxID=2980497 RepID=UPI0021CF6D27|nr:FKBP-type peptidyl-prolyl cis-trans isomerase [Catenovulum sp. 2E275]MCU4676386.1 FKBP-type peptidyl-prolyl cis-trans isomerase [Catenovulum sp. 2E275]
MQKLGMVSVLAAALAMAGCGEKTNTETAQADSQQTQQKEAVTLQNMTEKQAYGLGVNFGAQLKATVEQINSVGLSLDMDMVKKGVEDSLAGSPALSEQEIQAAMQELQQQHQQMETAKREEEGKKFLEEGEKFLAENAKKEGVKTTESGLQYEVVEAGEGESPKATDTVKVHYTGTLIDGTKFDSSVDRGEPATFPLNRVIPGWTEGVQLMKVGSKYRFYVPYNLAYGEHGTGGIPPYSTLIFDVELISIEG